MELKWVCLYNDCGHVNLDDFLKTATPTCEVCRQRYWWDELISEKQMAAGNVLLESELEMIDELDAEDRGGDDFEFVLAYSPIWAHEDNDVQIAAN